MAKLVIPKIEMNWYLMTVQKIGDAFGLMMIEVQGKNEEEARARLVSVMDIRTVHIKDCEEV